MVINSCYFCGTALTTSNCLQHNKTRIFYYNTDTNFNTDWALALINTVLPLTIEINFKQQLMSVYYDPLYIFNFYTIKLPIDLNQETNLDQFMERIFKLSKYYL